MIAASAIQDAQNAVTGIMRKRAAPTLRAVLLFACSIPVALLIVTMQHDFWHVSFYVPVAVLVLLVADMLMAFVGNTLETTVKAPPRLYVGQEGAIRVTFAIAGLTRLMEVEALLEVVGDVEPPRIHKGELKDGAIAFFLPILPKRRGQVKIEALWVRWRGPLGLAEIQARRAVATAVDVVPDVNGIHEAALQFFARDAVYGVKAQRMRGEGMEFESLCEYAQGMDTRFIDWKHSARHRKLLCKEFRQERNHQIVLGFDTGHLMLEPIEGMPKLDHAIKAGLLLSWISLHGGDLVGGCGFDVRFRSFLKPSRGMQYFTQVQRFTAGLDYHSEETNFTLGLAELNARLQRRALVVLFTEFVDSIAAELLLESLQLLTRRHVVVFVTLRDPMLTQLQSAAPDDFTATAKAVVADDFLRERAVVLERMARLGVHCLDVAAQSVSSALLNKYLMVKQRGLL